VHGQTFQDWFVNDFMLNKYGMSPLVSGFFWDDFWPAPGGGFPDALRGVVEDMGLDQDHTGWATITEAYHQNMDALRTLLGLLMPLWAHSQHGSTLGSVAIACRPAASTSAPRPRAR
jgi:hypothetical protein